MIDSYSFGQMVIDRQEHKPIQEREYIFTGAELAEYGLTHGIFNKGWALYDQFISNSRANYQFQNIGFFLTNDNIQEVLNFIIEQD